MTSYTPVLDASDYPFSAIFSIHVTYSDRSISRGTGVVIGENDVLTSAHVVQPEPGLRVRSIEVIPGYDDGIKPFGTFTVSFRRWYSVDEDGDGLLDFADVTVIFSGVARWQLLQSDFDLA